MGRTATVRGCRARIRNLLGSRGIPPRRLRQAPAFCGRLGRREPLHVARLQAADGAEERSLDLLRQRAHFTDAVQRWLTGSEAFTAKLNPAYAPYGDYDQLMRLEEWYGRK